jgi:hypothetical protein
VKVQENIAAHLKEFIDQLIVPLLVDELFATTGHLYSARSSYYDGERPSAEAAKEAAYS